ncbi:MAG: hypothetical protein OXC71_04525 [Chloroflexi bacterium]|nr:hypothetical protein [Chloroflexota bacterium]
MTRLAYTVAAVVVILAVLALFSRDDDEEGPATVATATPAPATATPVPATATPTATATPAATATPDAAAATPTVTPTRTATPTPSPTPSATPVVPTLTPPDPTNTVLPTAFVQLAAALPEPGLALTDAFEPSCPGASVEPIVFAGPDFEEGDRFAVWVFWPYPDREAFWEQWVINARGRAESRLDGCEPPNGYVYFNRGLLIWFVGFYGSEVDPGSPPTSRAEIREHPVLTGFLGIQP